MKKRRWGAMLLGVGLFCGINGAAGDQLIFKNGRTMDCTVEAVRARDVVISLGGGRMTIPKSELKKIRRSAKRPAKKATPQHAGSSIFSERFAPPEYAHLAAEVRTLMGRRNEAYDANYMIQVHEGKAQELEAQCGSLKQKIAQLEKREEDSRRQVSEIDLPERVPHQSARIAQYNALLNKRVKLQEKGENQRLQLERMRKEYRLTQERVTETRASCEPLEKTIRGYMQALVAFEDSYAARRKKVDVARADQTVRAFFEKIDGLLVRFQEEARTAFFHDRSWASQ